MTFNNTSFSHQELLALAKWHIEQDQLDQALAKIKPVIADQSPVEEALIVGARLYAQLSLYREAQKLFERYIDQNPNTHHEAFQLGMTYFDMGEINDAIIIWDQVLEKQPTYPPALFYSAQAKIQSNRTEDARIDLNKLIQTTSPDNLYFNQAKKLLNAINNKDQSSASDSDTFFKNKETYEIEH